GAVAMRTWVDNGNALFGTSGGGIAADTGEQPIPAAAGLALTGVVPYSVTTQIHATFNAVAGTSVSLNNTNAISPSPMATPTINTTPDVTSVTLGTSSVTLHDTAVLAGGFNPTGTITFTLVYNGN